MQVQRDQKEQEKHRVLSHLTEEHEHAHVELQQSGDAECPPLCAAQRIEEQLSAQRALPLLGPHVNLLLAVSKRTVLPILALLTLLHLCRTQRENVKQDIKHTFLPYFNSIWLLGLFPELILHNIHSSVLFIIHTFTEYKCPQEVVPCRPWPDPLPSGVIYVFEAAQQHIPLAAVCCLWLILVVHHSGTCAQEEERRLNYPVKQYNTIQYISFRTFVR